MCKYFVCGADKPPIPGRLKTHVYVLSQQLVRHLVLVHHVVVKSRAGEGRAEQETENTAQNDYCQSLFFMTHKSKAFILSPSKSTQILPTQWLHSEIAGFGASLTMHILLLRPYDRFEHAGDSRSPESADRLAHRRDILQHPLRGLERAFALLKSGGLSGTSEGCAAERGGDAGGHFCVFAEV